MSTKYLGEKISRQALADILRLIKGVNRYTSREIVAILQSDYSPEIIRNTLYRLQRQRYISGGAYDGYLLTQKGTARLEALEFDQLAQTAAWDKTWRLVIYDIPEQDRKARDTIRRLIKKLGFVQLQQSVWAHPLPCLEDFEKIRKAYGIDKHLLLIETPHTAEHQALFEIFKGQYPELTY